MQQKNPCLTFELISFIVIFPVLFILSRRVSTRILLSEDFFEDLRFKWIEEVKVVRVQKGAFL